MGPAPRRPSVLVGFLHVDEPTVPAARAALAEQIGITTTVMEVARLPQQAAHRVLYDGFDARTDEHDLIVKLDGDMILVQRNLLWAVWMLMQEHPTLDMVSVGVDDWFSGERIHGLAAWRGGVRWLGRGSALAPDLVDTTVRDDAKFLDVGRPLVLHGVDPGREQAARYGAHRALKSVATRKQRRIDHLSRFVELTQRDPAGNRTVALAAMLVAIEDPPRGEQLVATTVPDAELDHLARIAEDPGLGARVLTALAEQGLHPTSSMVTVEEVPPVIGLAARLRGHVGRLRAALRRHPDGGRGLPSLPGQAALEARFVALLTTGPS